MAAPAAADTVYPNPIVGSTFEPDAQGWESAGSGCVPDLQTPLLCSTVNEHRTTGGNPGGALFTTFTTFANIAGSVEGAGTWRSPEFTLTGTPTGAQFSLQRKATIGGLINQGGEVTFTATLVRTDVTPNTRKPLVTQTITENEPAFVTVPAQNIDAANLQAGGKYRIELAGTFTSLLQALQGTVAIAYDNVRLRVQDGTDDGNVAPAVFTLPATGVTESTATLNGLVDPNGSATTLNFDYRKAGTNDAFTATTGRDAGTGKVPLPFSESIVSGLEKCTTYEFRVKAINAVGSTDGSLVQFRTFCAPQVVTLPASPIGADNAGLNMSLRPNGPPTTFNYTYSLSPDLANPVATEVRGPVESTGVESPLTETVQGLQPATTYYFRGQAANRLGSADGAIVSFRTQQRSTPGVPGNLGSGGQSGAPGGPGAPGKPGGTSPTNTRLNSSDRRALLRIRSARVLVGQRGRRRGQIRLRIFCRRRTGQNCAGTVKLRTRGRINPSSIPGRKRARRKVTFATFEYQLAVGKSGVAISQIQPEKLDLLKRIKSVPIDILVTVTDADNNRQTIRRAGTLVLAR